MTTTEKPATQVVLRSRSAQRPISATSRYLISADERAMIEAIGSG
ncbi:MAG: hypothetical protein OEM84_06305 [Acidimicrobiia bacterium]|nr:hypothetical protein [Acidimicrobiia bacterium]